MSGGHVAWLRRFWLRVGHPAMPIMSRTPINASAEAVSTVGDRDKPPSFSRAPIPATLEIEQGTDVSHRLDLQWLRARLSDALPLIASASGRPVRRTSILVVDDQHMIALNQRHTGQRQCTDVLSFDLSGNQPGAAIEADIAVNADEAARRAAEFGHSIERELLLYCIHGVLHCAGYDDHDEAGYAAMHAEEDRILCAIGVGATFNASAQHEAAGPEEATP